MPQNRTETLGPAERIIQSLTQYLDHAQHNRPGVVFEDNRTHIGVRWQQATWVKKDNDKIVYIVEKIGKKQKRTEIGIGLPNTDEVHKNGRKVARWQPPGLFPEVVAYIYKQIAEVYKIDNEFAAKWASWAFNHEDNRDLKVILAAFMLVQNRYGEPIVDGEDKYLDEDYRAVGEAMCLLRKNKASFSPRLILRIGEVLSLPQVAEINKTLGFGLSQRRAAMGRYNKMVEKWLKHIETNTKILEGLVKGGFRKAVMQLARKVGYKPESERFFEILRWKQVQNSGGHRTLAIGKAVQQADSWAELSENEVCNKISNESLSWKVIAGKIPASIGLTPAIMAASMESKALSDQDLIIMTPTLEELGLLNNAKYQKIWQAAMDKAENQRAANIARNVKSEKVKEQLEEAADKATAKAVAEVVKDMKIYIFVDKSGSMDVALEEAKTYLAKFVGAFPLDKLHVCVFNTVAREIEIKAQTSAAVKQAFRGHRAGGGTSYAEAVLFLTRRYQPADTEDALFIFIGDQLDDSQRYMQQAVEGCGFRPMAFGLLHVESHYSRRFAHVRIVEQTAANLGLPCFMIDEKIFEDPYAVPRTIRNIVAATPVSQTAAPAPTRRKSIIDTILDTPLLQKPVWA